MTQKQDYYFFPAILDYADDGITIDFPDLPGCMPCAFSTKEALHNAREALGLHLYNMEEDGDIIPSPTEPIDIKHKKNQTVILVDVFMPHIRDAQNNKAVNKMCTLPQWLLSAGKDSNINFSQTLQDALIAKLGLKRKIEHRRNYSRKNAEK